MRETKKRQKGGISSRSSLDIKSIVSVLKNGIIASRFDLTRSAPPKREKHADFAISPNSDSRGRRPSGPARGIGGHDCQRGRHAIDRGGRNRHGGDRNLSKLTARYYLVGS